MIGTCLDCDANIELDENVEIGDVVTCPECKARLEVLDLDPVVLDYAVEEEFGDEG